MRRSTQTDPRPYQGGVAGGGATHRPAPRCARILRHVDSAIRVGAVTPRETAERFDISVRKLHHLFAGEQRTFMQTVMDRRAQWCALAMSMTPDATPTALARRWGFADSSHFAKAWDRLDHP